MAYILWNRGLSSTLLNWFALDAPGTLGGGSIRVAGSHWLRGMTVSISRKLSRPTSRSSRPVALYATLQNSYTQIRIRNTLSHIHCCRNLMQFLFQVFKPLCMHRKLVCPHEVTKWPKCVIINCIDQFWCSILEIYCKWHSISYCVHIRQ